MPHVAVVVIFGQLLFQMLNLGQQLLFLVSKPFLLILKLNDRLVSFILSFLYFLKFFLLRDFKFFIFLKQFVIVSYSFQILLIQTLNRQLELLDILDVRSAFCF